MNKRFRVHYLLSFPNGDYSKEHYDVSVATPEAAADATRTRMKSMHPNSGIVIGKVKMLREEDNRDGRYRGKRK